jgi:hypothetical protein
MLISSKLVRIFSNDLVDNQAMNTKKFVPVLKHTSKIVDIFTEALLIVQMQANERKIKIVTDFKKVVKSKMKIDTQRLQ